MVLKLENYFSCYTDNKEKLKSMYLGVKKEVAPDTGFEPVTK